MSLDEVAQQLADTARIGLTPELAQKLKVRSVDATKGQLMAASDGDSGPVTISLLAIYVIDDTDFWDRGEIYWWSIPVLKHANNTFSWSYLSGLPNGREPVKVGDKEWMSSLDLKTHPLLAVVPSDESISACVIRFGLYDDDKTPANLPAAMTEGHQFLASCMQENIPSLDHVVAPTRDAIYRSLKANEDDVMVDEDIVIQRSGQLNFQCGLIGTVFTSFARVYYISKDAQRTEQFGPIDMEKNDAKLIKFSQPMQAGGRLSILSQGDLSTPFGELDVNNSAVSKMLDTGLAASLANGVNVSTSKKSAKVVAFYTPPISG